MLFSYIKITSYFLQEGKVIFGMNLGVCVCVCVSKCTRVHASKDARGKAEVVCVARVDELASDAQGPTNLSLPPQC